MNFKNSSTKLNNWSLRQPVNSPIILQDLLQNSEIFFGCTTRHVGAYFPDKISKLYPLQWNCRVLTTGLPGTFLKSEFKIKFSRSKSIHFSLYYTFFYWIMKQNFGQHWPSSKIWLNCGGWISFIKLCFS